MAENSGKSAGSSGVGRLGFFGMMAILFIGLKLTGNIRWSWWLVLSPLWAPAVAILVVVAIIALICLACAGIDVASRRARTRRAMEQIDPRYLPGGRE